MEDFSKYQRKYGHRAKDQYRRDQNIEDDRALCTWCAGTGNELFSMYRECPECGGLGYRIEDGSSDE